MKLIVKTSLLGSLLAGISCLVYASTNPEFKACILPQHLDYTIMAQVSGNGPLRGRENIIVSGSDNNNERCSPIYSTDDGNGIAWELDGLYKAPKTIDCTQFAIESYPVEQPGSGEYATFYKVIEPLSNPNTAQTKTTFIYDEQANTVTCQLSWVRLD